MGNRYSTAHEAKAAAINAVEAAGKDLGYPPAAIADAVVFLLKSPADWFVGRPHKDVWMVAVLNRGI